MVISSIETIASERTLSYLKGLRLFAKLSDNDLKPFAKAAIAKKVNKGQLLYSEEDRADHFYVIRSGWLKLSHSTADGTEVVLGMQTSGTTVGEQCSFDHGHHTTTVHVVEDAELIQLPINLLQKQVRINNQLACNMLLIMAADQRRNELNLIQYLLYSAPQRIGCFLLKLCDSKDLADGMVLSLPYDKMHIASILGMRGATFSRALKSLSQEAGIHISGSRVTIDSVQQLLDYVGDCYTLTRTRHHPHDAADYLEGLVQSDYPPP